MPKPRTRVYVESEEGIPPNAVPLDPDAQRAAELEAENIAPEDIEELFRVSDEMRTTGGVVLQFTRTLPVLTAGYVGEMAPAEFTLDRVRREFGIGTYRVRCMGPKGYVPGGGKLVIAPVVEKPQTPQSGIEDVLAIIKADREKNSERMKEWAGILAGPLTALLTPMLTNIFAPKNQVKELLEGLAALKGLTPEPKEPPTMTKQLDEIAAIMERFKSMAGDEKPVVGSTWIDLIREAVGGVKDMLPGLLAARAGVMPTAGAIPMARPLPAPIASPQAIAPDPAASISAAPASPQANGGDNPMLLLIPWLRATLESLIIQAARDRDPALYAEVTVDNLPLGTDPKVFKEFIERADWWQMLERFEPRVSPYVGWFNAFRREVLEILKEDEPKQPQPPRDEMQEFGTPGENHGSEDI